MGLLGMLGGFDGLALHQFLAFAESDGVSMACLALALHQFLAFAESDGVSMACLALALHQIPRFV